MTLSLAASFGLILSVVAAVCLLAGVMVGIASARAVANAYVVPPPTTPVSNGDVARMLEDVAEFHETLAPTEATDVEGDHRRFAARVLRGVASRVLVEGIPLH